MSSIEIKECLEGSHEISEELINKIYPKPEYRVTPRLYRADKILIPGTARAGLFFVLDGKCKCNFGGDDGISIVLGAGQYINFPEGRYQIEPLENKDAKIVFVWNVAKLFKEIFPDHPNDI